ncbi:YjbF family lipoprotein [Stenotrophomonas sp. TWI377]|uniref:YjbF family lipoprotein n=1 Tax=Stenotrophomonas sp. TWI377 TaxID=3136775 RepID=UPI00320BB1D1
MKLATLFAAKPLDRLKLVMAVSVLLLTGCTTASRGTTESFRLLLNRDVTGTPESVALNRFPQAQVKTPDLTALIVLSYIDGETQAWYAGDRAVFRTNAQGLLMGVSSENQRIESRVIGISPFSNLTDVSSPVNVRREYDWLPSYVFGVILNGTLRPSGVDTVVILGQPRRLSRFEETLTGEGIRFHNTYWADPATGFIWKSKQMLAPGYSVELVQLKPYRLTKD